MHTMSADDFESVLFSEYGVTFLEGLGEEHEDVLALELCRKYVSSPLGGVVKILTNKEESVFSEFPTVKIALTKQRQAGIEGGPKERFVADFAEKIRPHIEQHDIVVMDLSLFADGETWERYCRLAEGVRLEPLAKEMNVNFLIPAHFERPFSAWRNSQTLWSRHIRVVQLFCDRGKHGVNFFGGTDFS